MSLGPIDQSSFNPIPGNANESGLPTDYKDIGVPSTKAPALRKGEQVSETTIMRAHGLPSISLAERNEIVNLFLAKRGR